MSKIVGKMAGCYSPMGKTFIIADENGNELTGVVTEEKKVFTAGLDDIRSGKIAANAEGIVIGMKDIPAYETTQSSYYVFSGENYSIPLEDGDKYDYTKIQGLIAKYDSDPVKRTAVDKVIIGDNVYAVNSTEILSTITKNTKTKSIDLNMINNTSDTYIIYYFTIKRCK